MIDEMESLGYTCYWIKYDDRHRKLGMISAFLQTWKLIRNIRPDVLHCNLFDDSVPGLLAGWLSGIRVRVVSKQETGYHWMHTPRWVSFDRLINWLATDIIVISKESMEFLREHEKAPVHKLHLVYNGIPKERFTNKVPATMAALRDRFKIAGRFPVIGTVARFIPWKGYFHVVNAAQVIVKRHPQAVFLFCGMGQQQEEIKEQVLKAGLKEHVVFTGWVDRAEMASFYSLLDIYLHASILEPFGLVYPEAMMNAVPVVTTRTGAAMDAIEDGRNGILVNERSGQALATGIERLLSMEMRKVGAAGRKTAMNMFAFEVMWKGTTGVYTQALARGK